MYHKKSEKGQALILIVLAIVGLIGLTALAVDGGMAYSERRQAQNTADASVLDAALAKVRGGTWQSEGLARALSNGFDNNGTTNTVVVNNPPAAGCNGVNSPYTGNSEYLQVIIRASTQTFFGPVVGITEVNNCVEAIARAKPPTEDNMVFGNAIVALKPDGRGAMRSHGNNDLTVYGGGIFVNSDDDCAFDQMGNSAIHSNDGGMNVVGGVCLRGSIDPASVINTGIAPIPYPPTSLPPTPLCTGDAIRNGNILSPGNYVSNHSFPPSGVDTLNPGIYCVDATFMMNAHDRLVGHDVVIYMVDGNIHWNGGAEIELTAPTSGPFAGLLIYMPMTNDEGIILNGNMESSLVGTILAPASDIQLNGTMTSSMYHTQVIGYTVDLIGTADIIVSYNAGDQYEAPVPPQIELIR